MPVVNASAVFNALVGKNPISAVFTCNVCRNSSEDLEKILNCAQHGSPKLEFEVGQKVRIIEKGVDGTITGVAYEESTHSGLYRVKTPEDSYTDLHCGELRVVKEKK